MTKLVTIFLLPILLYAQSTTYSKIEEDMVRYLNHEKAYAHKHNSIERFNSAIDSANKFLKNYPNSFAKLNVLSYLLEMSVTINANKSTVYNLIDSVLYYDNLAVTKLRIAEIVIDNYHDYDLGENLLNELISNLNYNIHLQKAHMLKAKTDLAKGNRLHAKFNMERAIEIDSTRYEPWYLYLAYFKSNEQYDEFNKIQRIIKKLEGKQSLDFAFYGSNGPNRFKNISKVEFLDIDGNRIELSKFTGKIIVINYFSFWCSICSMEFPILKKLITKYPNIVFLFYNTGETKEELENIFRKKREYQFLRDQTILKKKITSTPELIINWVPHTLVIDKKGKIRFDYRGYDKGLGNLLNENLQILLNE